MIFSIQLVGIPVFWIETDVLEKNVIVATREFDFERGKFGFSKLNKAMQAKIRNEFCCQYNFNLVYLTSLDRELKIRERSAAWLCRRLTDHTGNQHSERMIARYTNGTSKPSTELKKTIESLLAFSWN
ncbi:MAG: hypothetical protein U0T69_11160 [Chitinophagales bacterium]